MKTEFKKSHLSRVINNKEMEPKNEIGNVRQLSSCVDRQPKRFIWALPLILGLWVMGLLALAEDTFRYRYLTLNDSLQQPGFFLVSQRSLTAEAKIMKSVVDRRGGDGEGNMDCFARAQKILSGK
ncbi:hypothetical protein [Methylosarcina fibrata]|uniref:hypothetical protein n=1 Tax=Methylosarcina fibrata TaxID=105972 RepID=UPI00037334AE|nr:hypothetical protein [Methylosarcina fibrata]